MAQDQDVKHDVSDHDEESYEEEEKMERTPLRVSQTNAEKLADEISGQTATPATRECNLCGKTFSNGKALGGHRRSHFVAAKNHQHKVKTLFTKQGNNSARFDDDDDGKHTCCVCKKKFPSKNALYGHMRSHPERDWRGVCLPSSSSSYHNSDSSMEENKEDQDDNCVGRVVVPNKLTTIDISKSISPSWKKTDKRGRKCADDVYQAAVNLMHLSCTKCLFDDSDMGLNNTVVEPKSPEFPFPCKKREIGESSSGQDLAKKIKFVLGSLKLGNQTEGGGDFYGDKLNRGKGLSKSGVYLNCGELQDHVGNFDERKMKIEKKGKKSEILFLKSKTKGLVNENETQEKPGDYKCSICDKSFSTFQGLGGHRSLHKQKNMMTMDEPKPSDSAMDEENHVHRSNHLSQVDDETPLSKEALTEEASQSTGSKVLDFDLNEPNVMED